MRRLIFFSVAQESSSCLCDFGVGKNITEEKSEGEITVCHGKRPLLVTVYCNVGILAVNDHSACKALYCCFSSYSCLLLSYVFPGAISPDLLNEETLFKLCYIGLVNSMQSFTFNLEILPISLFFFFTRLHSHSFP